MGHPDLIDSHLEGEDAVATVNLSGEDALVITPTRSLLYEGEGILSDESVTEYPHDVAEVSVSTGRRKATVEFTYPIEGKKELQVSNDRLDAALHYLLAGVLHDKGITTSGESMRSVFRFNDLTVIVTSHRVLTHVGAPVWDEEFEGYPFADLTGLSIEEGNIATEFVLYLDGRSQRVKVPKGRAEEVKRSIEEAILAYFDVDTMAEFEDLVGDADDTPEPETPSLSFEEAVQPLGASDPEPTSTDDEEWPYASVDDESAPDAVDVAALAELVETLQSQVAEQRELLVAQEAALDELADRLADE